MQLSTNTSATFNDWFETLKQVAAHDYNLTITDQEQSEYIQYYTGGLNQNEALGA